MITALDDGVGEVMEALRTRNLLENTLVVFLSDNGAKARPFTRNQPFRGYKKDVTEGGVHVPFAFHWKGRLPAEAVYDGPISALDIVATAAAAAGVPLPSDRVYDGLDVTPFLRGDQTAPHRTLFWRWLGLGKDDPPGALSTLWAVRDGPLKLVTSRETVGMPPRLYRLSTDPGETQDLAASRPGDVNSLKELYYHWNSQLAFPRWIDNTDALAPLVLAGDWNHFKRDEQSSPWRMTRVTAPGVAGTPDGFNWFKNTIRVAARGGHTTAGVHQFTFVSDRNLARQWGGATINIDDVTFIPFYSGTRIGPKNTIALENGYFYSCRILEGGHKQLHGPLKLAVMKTSAPPISVKRSGQTPAAPTPGDAVVVDIVASKPKSPEERIYLRWSTDFFMTSHMVAATGSGVNYSATIPPQPAGTPVVYRVLTSTTDLSPLVAPARIDALTLATSKTTKFVVSADTSAVAAMQAAVRQ